MTVRFYQYWKGIHPGTTATFSERKEKQLISDGYAVDINTAAPNYHLRYVPLTPEDQADAQARISAALAQYD